VYAFELLRWDRILIYLQYLENEMKKLHRNNELKTWSEVNNTFNVDTQGHKFMFAFVGTLVPLLLLVGFESLFGLYVVFTGELHGGDREIIAGVERETAREILAVLATLGAVCILTVAVRIYRQGESDKSDFKEALGMPV